VLVCFNNCSLDLGFGVECSVLFSFFIGGGALFPFALVFSPPPGVGGVISREHVPHLLALLFCRCLCRDSETFLRLDFAPEARSNLILRMGGLF